MAGYLVFILLFILPFIIFPIGASQFEIPKVILSHIVVWTLLFSVIIQKGKSFFLSFDHVQLILAGVLFFISAVHLVFFPSPISFLGNPARMQGILLLWSLLLFSLVASRVKLPKISGYFYLFLLLATFVLSLLLSNQNGRAVATLGEPNALAAFVIFLWPFIFFAKYESKNVPYVQILGGLITVFIILLSQSVSGLAAFAIQLLFLVLFKKANLPLKKVVFVSVFFIGLVYLFPFFDRSPYENRVDIWNTAITAGVENPILGAGFGNAEIQIRQTSQIMHDKLIGYYVDSGHNIFIDWWIQSGIVGLTTLIILIVISIRNFYLQKKAMELIILLGLIAVLSFNPASVVTLLAFWWTIGRSFAYNEG